MSSASKACGQAVEKWIKVPDVNSHCVNEVAKLGVEQFNKKYEYSLKFQNIYEGWFLEFAPKILNYKLHIRALDFLGRLLNYEVIVHEEKTPTEKIRKFVSLIVLATDGHYVGDVKPPPEDKWIKIPNLLYPFVQLVAKFTVEEFNRKYGDSLKYDSIYDGWYAEIGGDNIRFRLHIKAKDCVGRVRSYDVLVLIQHSLTLKTKTLLSFEIVENWVKIPDLKQHCVQVIVKFAVEEFNAKYKVDLKFDSIYDGWYVELGPTNLKYRFLIKALDVLDRLLNYEIIVVEEKHHNEKIKKLVTFNVIATDGHHVGVQARRIPVRVWIRLFQLASSIVQEIINITVRNIQKETGDNLYYDSVYEGWYCELGGDDIEFRLHIKVKDCIGRVRNYEAFVLVIDFNTKRDKKFVSFKSIETK